MNETGDIITHQEGIALPDGAVQVDEVRDYCGWIEALAADLRNPDFIHRLTVATRTPVPSRNLDSVASFVFDLIISRLFPDAGGIGTMLSGFGFGGEWTVDHEVLKHIEDPVVEWMQQGYPRFDEDRNHNLRLDWPREIDGADDKWK
jgi:hypothetical protein